jgi:radical SAM superfamily enzyme YgiQ (UPF0313 family)
MSLYNVSDGSASSELSKHDSNAVTVPVDQKFRILFYHAGFAKDGWIYTAALQLKTHIDLNYPELADQLEWLVPLQMRVSDDKLLEHVQQTRADVLCTGHYVWNHEFIIDQLAAVKSRLPAHLKVISGGPSININIESDFFDRYPYIDFAVYGAGEQAFADIMTHLVLHRPLITMTASNCGWKHRETGKTVVAPHKYVKMIQTSPFLHNQKLFTAMVKNLVKLGTTQLQLGYTVTRGCPYKCTFCDWNSGFDTKVTRRKGSYREEIDLFQRLKIRTIMWSDANFGQYDEDVEIAEYMAHKNINEDAGFTIMSGNFSKLKKATNLKIFHIMIASRLVKNLLALSIQDTNQQVLENINRPDVGWEVHAGMVDELYVAWPHLVIAAQLIYGLPGQTTDSWRQTLAQITGKNLLPQIYTNVPLPASPAMYDSEYQAKWQFEYAPGLKMGDFAQTSYRDLIPKQCVSFDQWNMVEMHTLSCVYSGLALIKIYVWKQFDIVLDIDVIADAFATESWYQDLQQQLYRNWTQNQNYFYVIQDTQFTEPLHFGFHLATSKDLFQYVYQHLSTELQHEFDKDDVQADLTDWCYKLVAS